MKGTYLYRACGASVRLIGTILAVEIRLSPPLTWEISLAHIASSSIGDDDSRVPLVIGTT
jgi:hypothetical protein